MAYKLFIELNRTAVADKVIFSGGSLLPILFYYNAE